MREEINKSFMTLGKYVEMLGNLQKIFLHSLEDLSLIFYFWSLTLLGKKIKAKGSDDVSKLPSRKLNESLPNIGQRIRLESSMLLMFSIY